MAIADLTNEEAESLGRNIKAIDKAMKRFWNERFPHDALKRLYVVYFFEQEFETPPPNEKYHLHIHLIPRPESLNSCKRLQRTECGTTWVDGWRTPELAGRKDGVPAEYTRPTGSWSVAEELLSDLRTQLEPKMIELSPVAVV